MSGAVSTVRGAQPPRLSRSARAGAPSHSPPLHHQVTRPCSYSRKSHFDFEEEDVDKLEIR